jgi:Arc/MetJ family transcription regulator
MPSDDVIDVENRDHLRGLGRIHPPCLGETDPTPHVHVVAEVLDLLRLGEEEQVPDLAEVRRMSGVVLKRFQQPDRQALQSNIGLDRELLANTARALAGRLRAQRFPLEEHHVDIALRKLVGECASHDAATRDDYVSAFHSRTFPRTRR